MSGVRRGDGSDEAEAAMRAAIGTPDGTTGARVPGDLDADISRAEADTAIADALAAIEPVINALASRKLTWRERGLVSDARRALLRADGCLARLREWRQVP